MDTKHQFANLNNALADIAAKNIVTTPAQPQPERLVLNNFQTQAERMSYDRRNA